MSAKIKRKPGKASYLMNKSKSAGAELLDCCASSSESTSDCSIVPRKFKSQALNMDLRKEYIRYCKLYSSEPLEFISGPLHQATICQGPPGQTNVPTGGVTIDLKGRGLRGVDCIAIGKILGSNVNVETLNLSDCLLLPQGLQALLDGIARNTNLQVLELRGNNLQSQDMLEPLGGMLKINSNLKQLILEWNHIGTNRDGFISFCDGLATNSGLEHVDLRNNQISDECAIDICAAMKQNKYLKDLDLRWNSIGVKGARAFYDLININTSLSSVQLGGNFVPDEIVQHIEQMLLQRSRQEEMVKDYSSRTTILTRQLQKTEEEYQNEIKNIMNLFGSEEKEYRRLLDEGQKHINRISKERDEEVEKNVNLQKEIGKLNKMLAEASVEQTKLQVVVSKQENRIEELDKSFKSQTGGLETSFTKKVKDLQELIDSLSSDKTNLIGKLKMTETELQVRTGEVNQLKETIKTLHITSDQMQKQFDERLNKAKESWTGFQSEIESAERKEIQRLENQMNEMNSSLMDHLKVLENKKADAEEEVRRLKILLVTSKSETEEELAKLRASLADEHNSAVKAHIDQLANLRHENERLETEVARLEAQVHKLESENGKVARQCDTLKMQLAQATEDMAEVHESNHNAITRTKNDLKETTERLSKEEETNRELRSEIQELKQNVANLTVKVSKLSQEKKADLEFWKKQIKRREEELTRLKTEDMRRAALLHEAFSVYMRSTSVATGLPIPAPCCAEVELSPVSKQPSNRPTARSSSKVEEIQITDPQQTSDSAPSSEVA